MKYKVDARVGCISVSVVGEKTSNGLHDDMDEVVAYWQGRRDKDNGWEVPQIYIDKANSLCNKLNALTTERDTLKEALRMACVEFGENECPDNIRDEHECPHGLTCEYSKDEYFKCWQEYFLTQATPEGG